jgi:regulator of sigma E protease
MAVVLLVVGLVLFVGLVVIHEFGHFIVARRNGVEVEEFGIGFPPKIWSRKTRGGFIFSINLLPLGGFVRLKGEHDSDTEKGTFGAATTWAKTKIMAAGVAMNLLAAFVLFMVLAWIGMPQMINNQFTVKSDTKIASQELLAGGIQSGSPAAKAGLTSRDQLIGAWTGTSAKSIVGDCAYPILGHSMNATCHQNAIPLSVNFRSATSLVNFTKDHAGQTVGLLVKRNGKFYMTAPITLLTNKVVAASEKTNNPKGHIGISPVSYTLQRSTWSAPVVALGVMKQFTILTFQGLGSALKGLGSIIAGFTTHNTVARQSGQTQASSQVSGPVGIFMILKDGSALGYQLMLMIVAVISLSLAIMNVLPIPALDGGKVFVTYVSRLFRKRISETVEDWVYGTSFAFLLALIAIITVVDVKHFF